MFQSDASAARFKHIEVRDRLVWKASIRKELLKDKYHLDASRKLLKARTLNYWQLRMMMSVSNFFYTHWKTVPVRKIIGLNRILTSLLVSPWYFWKKIKKC